MKTPPLQEISGNYTAVTSALARHSLQTIINTRNRNSHPETWFHVTEYIPNINSDEYEPSSVLFLHCTKLKMWFFFGLRIQWIIDLEQYDFGANAYNDTDKIIDKTESSPPYIELTLRIDPRQAPQIYESIYFDLCDGIRHELEHLTQSGFNTKRGKYIESDQTTRDAIASGKENKSKYFLLEKELDAYIHGLAMRAKKSKRSFKEVAQEYLQIWVDNTSISSLDSVYIYSSWKFLLNDSRYGLGYRNLVL